MHVSSWHPRGSMLRSTLQQISTSCAIRVSREASSCLAHSVGHIDCPPPLLKHSPSSTAKNHAHPRCHLSHSLPAVSGLATKLGTRETSPGRDSYNPEPILLKAESRDVICGKISAFIEAREMEVGEFCDAIGVSGNSYRDFLAQHGRDKGSESDTYLDALRFSRAGKPRA